MTLLPTAHGTFRPEFLFRPRSVAVIGASSAVGRAVLANLSAGGFAGGVWAAEEVGGLAEAAELGVVCALAGPIGPVFRALAGMGTRTCVVLCMAEGVGEAARAAGIRALGPGSFGVVVPKLGLNLSQAHLPPRAGRLALVSQSAALCRVVLDWAEPNGVGFSTIAGIGGNADIDFGLVLDWLSRDADTGAILLDIRRIRHPRRFISAARAAARLRPVVAIHAGMRLADPDGMAGAAFGAALRRCGVLEVSSLADMLAAAETLTRARPARGEGLAIVTNAIGPAWMAADAALRDGVALAALSEATRQVVGLARRGAFGPRGESIVYAGADAPMRLGEMAALLAGAPEVGGVLLVHAPTGAGDAAAMQAVAAAGQVMKVPLLVCAMGHSTGEAHRRLLADAGVPAFATPEEAVRGFSHLVQHRRIRAAARELPDSVVPDLGIDAAAAARALAGAAPGELAPAATRALLAAYGIAMGEAGGAVGRVVLRDDALFGPVLGVGGAGRDLAVDLPPLNLALAGALAARAGVRGQEGADAVADLLVRVSQLAVEQPGIAELEIDPLCLDAGGVRAGGARVVLRSTGARMVERAYGATRLAIPPYPSEWVRHFDARGQDIVIRPIRPEDAAAHAAFFGRLSPEDVRYRFFSAMRALSAEQIARLTQVDYEREMAFVAVRDGETVGVARLVREMDTGGAEFAVVVQADAKGRGVAGALMRQLLEWGRSKGVREVEGQVLADNAPMLGFVRKLGFSVRRMPGDADIMQARLVLAPPAGA